MGNVWTCENCSWLNERWFFKTCVRCKTKIAPKKNVSLVSVNNNAGSLSPEEPMMNTDKEEMVIGAEPLRVPMPDARCQSGVHECSHCGVVLLLQPSVTSVSPSAGDEEIIPDEDSEESDRLPPLPPPSIPIVRKKKGRPKRSM